MKRIYLIASCLAFAASLFVDCFCTGDGCNYKGIFLLLFGWVGIFTGDASLAWYANPFIVASWIMTWKNHKWSLLVSCIGVIICLSFLFFKDVIDNEGGVSRAITGYRIGYWLWVSSAAIMLAGNAFDRLRGVNG
jgi:hypothetical protein